MRRTTAKEHSLNPDDLHVEGFYLRPPFEGRAHDGVTVTHVPTGISAKCSSFNSLHKNRSAAIAVIVADMVRRGGIGNLEWGESPERCTGA